MIFAEAVITYKHFTYIEMSFQLFFFRIGFKNENKHRRGTGRDEMKRNTEATKKKKKKNEKRKNDEKKTNLCCLNHNKAVEFILFGLNVVNYHTA